MKKLAVAICTFYGIGSLMLGLVLTVKCMQQIYCVRLQRKVTSLQVD